VSAEDLQSTPGVKLSEEPSEEKLMLDHTQVGNKTKFDHFEKFIADSTCHGLQFCLRAKYKIRRFIWTCLITASLLFLGAQVYEGAVKYLDYPFTTTTTLTYPQKMPLPAVSICNLNDFRVSKMAGTKLQKLIDSYNETTNDSKGIWSYLADEITAEEYKNTTLGAYHTIENMLQNCTLIENVGDKTHKKCFPRDFESFYTTRGEKCYTLKPLPSISVIRLHMNIEYEEYDKMALSSGLKVILHNANEIPVDEIGFQISPGFKTDVLISKMQTTNLPYPYKSNCSSPKMKYFKGAYSKEMCQLEKLTDHLVKKCKCRAPFMPGNAQTCSLKESINCTWPEWEEHKKDRDTCPLACQQTSFKRELSQSYYPTRKMMQQFAEKEGNNYSDYFELQQKIRENYLIFEVQYKHNYYEHMIQEATYDVPVMLGDLGGKLGLFLGTSILTFIEFFDCLAVVVYSKFFEGKFTKMTNKFKC